MVVFSFVWTALSARVVKVLEESGESKASSIDGVGGDGVGDDVGGGVSWRVGGWTFASPSVALLMASVTTLGLAALESW